MSAISDDGSRLATADVERRRRLQAFLAHARSRLSPQSVGLPATQRRRVPGLRREEVAELAGVSAEWYRLLESGRPITVSSRLLGRLSQAFGLDAFEETLLFRLALPELYRAEIVASVEPPATMPSLIAAVTAFSDVEETRRLLSAQRERFLTQPPGGDDAPRGAAATLRPRILQSWQRSLELRVEPCRSEAWWASAGCAELAAEPTRERLVRAATSIVTHLADTLAGVGYAAVLTDAEGTILLLRSGAELQRKLDRIGFAPGAQWSEASAGTNAIGTALRDDRPLQLMSAEHFCEGWQDLTCTAAPIHEPGTGAIVGALDITGDYRLVRSQLVGTIVQYALEIEERLALSG